MINACFSSVPIFYTVHRHSACCLAQRNLLPCMLASTRCLQDEALNWQAAYKQRPPTEAIVFIVGGSTYEEAKAAAEWNSRGPGGSPQSGMRVLLGGSSVLNSDAFLKALGAAAAGNLLR
jgi:vacuolar protein sorting-associated protein 45